jgi:5'-nucleotidase
MRILVTNDDGINAEGLDVCEQIARALSDDVWVVAPEYDQSGVSHSLSINDPLRLRSIGPRRFAVKGTPTDCVIMGAHHLMQDRRPDLVLSGVNKGRNSGEDVTYSGTVAGAIEGAILNIPSVALSQAYAMTDPDRVPHWDTAIHYAPDLIRRVLKEGVPKDVLVNVNFPDCPPDKVRGVSVTTQGKRNQAQMKIDSRRDGRGNPYYWIAFHGRQKPATRDNTDLWALADNRISITPLRIDMTDEPYLTRLAQVFGPTRT